MIDQTIKLEKDEQELELLNKQLKEKSRENLESCEDIKALEDLVKRIEIKIFEIKNT